MYQFFSRLKFSFSNEILQFRFAQKIFLPRCYKVNTEYSKIYQTKNNFWTGKSFDYPINRGVVFGRICFVIRISVNVSIGQAFATAKLRESCWAKKSICRTRWDREIKSSLAVKSQNRNKNGNKNFMKLYKNTEQKDYPKNLDLEAEIDPLELKNKPKNIKI